MRTEEEKKSLNKKRELQRKLIIRFLNKVNRPVLIGEVALDLKVSLAEAEQVLNDMSSEENPEIRLASSEELNKLNLKVAFALTKPANPKLAFDA